MISFSSFKKGNNNDKGKIQLNIKFSYFLNIINFQIDYNIIDKRDTAYWTEWKKKNLFVLDNNDVNQVKLLLFQRILFYFLFQLFIHILSNIYFPTVNHKTSWPPLKKIKISNNKATLFSHACILKNTSIKSPLLAFKFSEIVWWEIANWFPLIRLLFRLNFCSSLHDQLEWTDLKSCFSPAILLASSELTASILKQSSSGGELVKSSLVDEGKGLVLMKKPVAFDGGDQMEEFFGFLSSVRLHQFYWWKNFNGILHLLFPTHSMYLKELQLIILFVNSQITLNSDLIAHFSSNCQ